MPTQVEVIPRRQRTGVIALTIGAGQEVLPDTLDMSNDPSLFVVQNTNSGIVGFNGLSQWRLERIGAYFKPANLEPGWVQLTASSETSEHLPLSPGSPVLELGWMMPPLWDGRLVWTPFQWVITPASQLLVTCWAQFVELPSPAAIARMEASCRADL
jgi:hypothetical protein